MIFGPSPKAETVPRYIENKEKDSIIFYRNKNISYQIGSQNFFK
jgi:hypothetical protein